MGIVLGYAILCAGGAAFAYWQGNMGWSLAGAAGSVLLFMLMLHFKREQSKARRFIAWMLDQEASIYDDTAEAVVWEGSPIGPRSRLVQYDAVVSLGLWTGTFHSRLFLASASKAGCCRVGYTALTLMLGWWGAPHGPVRTLQTVIGNLGGGQQLTVHEWLEYGEPRPQIAGMPPLIQAVYANQEQKVFELLEVASQAIYQRDAEGCTALMRAAEIGNLTVFDFLLAKGADLQDRDDYGDTVLIRAAAHGNAAVVQRILQFRVDPNVGNHRGDTALVWAETRGYPRIVRLLAAAGAKHGVAVLPAEPLTFSG